MVQLFIWKHNVYKQKRCSIIGKENAWEAWGGEGERVALIKSLIYVRWKEMCLKCSFQVKLNLSADKTLNNNQRMIWSCVRGVSIVVKHIKLIT